MLRSFCARGTRSLSFERPGSVVSDLVPALRNLTSRTGLNIVEPEMALLTIDARKACWRFIRPMSPVSTLPMEWRTRT